MGNSLTETEINSRMEFKTAWQPPEKIWNRMFFSIFFANMMLNLGQQMSNSLLSKYADFMGAPASQIGMLMSMFAITALIFRFISGPTINSVNRKIVVAAAMGLMMIAYLGFSFSTNVSELMLFRLIQGVGNSFANVCCLAIVSDVLPQDRFNAGMGYYACAQVVSQAIGPTVGLQLVSWFGYGTTYIINACTMGLAILFATQIKLAPRPPRKFTLKPSEMIAKEAFVPSAVVLLVAVGFTTINAFLIVYAGKRGVENGIGLFFTVYALTMLVTRPIVGKLTDRYGFVKIGMPSILMTVISLIIIGFSDTLWMFLLAAFVNAFGYGALQPALQSLCIQSVPPERRGSGSCTFYIGLDSATLIGPTIAGFVAEKMGYAPPMWITMTIPLIIGVTVVFLFRNRIRQIEEGFMKTAK